MHLINFYNFFHGFTLKMLLIDEILMIADDRIKAAEMEGAHEGI